MLARIVGSIGFVLGKDRQSYSLPLDGLSPLPPNPESEPLPSAEPLAAQPRKNPESRPAAATLQIGEVVTFVSRGCRLAGRIVRLNSKRAHVLCDNEAEYAVPYGRIERCTTGPVEEPADELAAVIRLAEGLLIEHGLTDWCFAFDHATRRAGCCDYGRKRISLALQFARRASAAEIRDTLLHEIAHALVGKKHHHDAHWRAKAVEIGGSGERCHSVRFCPPRYIISCRNGCWIATAERRRRHLVCRRCRADIVYQTYTEQRWLAGQPGREDKD